MQERKGLSITITGGGLIKIKRKKKRKIRSRILKKMKPEPEVLEPRVEKLSKDLMFTLPISKNLKFGKDLKKLASEQTEHEVELVTYQEGNETVIVSDNDTLDVNHNYTVIVRDMDPTDPE